MAKKKEKKSENPSQSKMVELKKKLNLTKESYEKFLKDHDGTPYTKEDMIKYKQHQLAMQTAREDYIEEMDRLSILQRKSGLLPKYPTA